MRGSNQENGTTKRNCHQTETCGKKTKKGGQRKMTKEKIPSVYHRMRTQPLWKEELPQNIKIDKDEKKVCE